MASRLVDFIHAQLDEDRAHARIAIGKHNDVKAEWSEPWSGAVHLGPREDLLITHDSGVSRHIIRHDPARVLRDVEAKRRIVRLRESWALEIENAPAEFRHVYEAKVSAVDAVLRSLAEAWSDHPHYDPDWQESERATV